MRAPSFYEIGGRNGVLATSRPFATDRYSIELQCMPPSMLSLPTRQWHVLSIILSAETEIERRRAGLTECEKFSRGDAGIYPAGQGEEIFWRDFVEAIHIHIRPSAFREICSDLLKFDSVSLRRVFRVRDDYIRKIGIELHHAATLPAHHRETVCDELIDRLAAYLATRYSTRDDTDSDNVPWSRFELVADYVSNRLADRITLDDLGCLIGLSRYHFSATFRAATGVSPYQYVLRRRVERAKYLLSLDTDSLASISGDCGFLDQSHFTRVFSQMTGTTPARFRQIQRGLVQPSEPQESSRIS